MPNMPLVQQLAAMQAQGAQKQEEELDVKGAISWADSVKKLETTLDSLAGLKEKRRKEAKRTGNPDALVRLDDEMISIANLIAEVQKKVPAQAASTATAPVDSMPTDSIPWQQQVEQMQAMLDGMYGTGGDTMPPDSSSMGSEDQRLNFLLRFLNNRLGLNLGK